MKLAVNGRFLCQNLTGVQRVALQYAVEIQKHGALRGWDVKTFCPPRPIQREAAQLLRAKELFAPKPHAFFWEQVALPAASKGRFLVNFGNTAPLCHPKQLVMLHDTAFAENSSWFSPSFALYYRLVVPSILRRSPIVLTVSAFSKKEILRHFDIPEAKIRVLPSWAGEAFENLRPQPPAEKDNYILAVASLEPRKNYAALLRGFSRLGGMTLKVAGGSSAHFAQDAEFSRLSTQTGAELLGRCSDEELLSLYRHGSFFCSLSFYEGFGLPPLEAMNAGCPLLLSDIPAHREVCGEAALYANPYDDEDIFQKMLRMQKNPSLREELALAGKERAALFQKQDTLKEFFEILKEVENFQA